MSTAYYYFVASLPFLEFNGKLPFTTDRFLEDCERLLAAKDFDILRSLLDKKEMSVTNPVINRIYHFENNIQNEIAIYRATKANKEPGDYIRGEYPDDHYIKNVIKQAVGAADPLDSEKIISRARWQFYEDLMSGQFFNLTFILLYALKLKIVERYHTIASPRGKDIYEQLKKIEFPEEFASNV